MRAEPEPRLKASHESVDAVSSAFLVTSVAGGDEAALRQLMARYDRLVRYTVFKLSRHRARSDPQWLDGVASATWAGFVRAIRRDAPRTPTSVAALVATIARNQTISALRRTEREFHAGFDLAPHPANEEAVHAESDPASDLERVEFLDRLRACLECLDADDRTLMGQLPAIMERRWQEAAGALGIAESTLRSRWARVLERLRSAMREKFGESVAPGRGAGDY